MVKIILEQDGKIIKEAEAKAVFGGIFNYIKDTHNDCAATMAFAVGEVSLRDTICGLAVSAANILSEMIGIHTKSEIEKVVLEEYFHDIFRRELRGNGISVSGDKLVKAEKIKED